MWTYGIHYLPVRWCEWDVTVGDVFTLSSGESCRILDIRQDDCYTKRYCSAMSNVIWEVSILPNEFIMVIEPTHIVEMCSICGYYRGNNVDL